MGRRNRLGLLPGNKGADLPYRFEWSGKKAWRVTAQDASLGDRHDTLVDRWSSGEPGSPPALVGAGCRDRSDWQMAGTSHSRSAASVRERRVRRGSYAGTLPPLPAHCPRGNGAHHGHGHCRDLHYRDDHGNGHVRVNGNSRPAGSELRAFPSAHHSALGEDE
jgi:hypothetical protein